MSLALPSLILACRGPRSPLFLTVKGPSATTSSIDRERPGERVCALLRRENSELRRLEAGCFGTPSLADPDSKKM